MAAKDGIAAAAAAVARKASEDLRAETGDFRQRHLPLPVSTTEQERQATAAVIQALGPRRGRPKGRRNDATLLLAGQMLEEYGSPLKPVFETIFRPVNELAEQLQCTPLEAFDRQQAAALGVAKFVHPQLAAVAVQSQRAVQVTLTVSQDQADKIRKEGVRTVTVKPTVTLDEPQQNQALSERPTNGDDEREP